MPQLSPVEVPEDLSAIFAHVEAAYPNEGCGVILRDREGRWRIRPMQNAQDRYHARDPEQFPRTSRTAYLLDPREQLAVWEGEAPARSETVRCIFHSHVDVGAYFSEEDRVMAAPDGQPLWPGVSYLVVAVDAGRATAARLYWWERGRFTERVIFAPGD